MPRKIDLVKGRFVKGEQLGFKGELSYVANDLQQCGEKVILLGESGPPSSGVSVQRGASPFFVSLDTQLNRVPHDPALEKILEHLASNHRRANSFDTYPTGGFLVLEHKPPKDGCAESYYVHFDSTGNVVNETKSPTTGIGYRVRIAQDGRIFGMHAFGETLELDSGFNTVAYHPHQQGGKRPWFLAMDAERNVTRIPSVLGDSGPSFLIKDSHVRLLWWGAFVDGEGFFHNPTKSNPLRTRGVSEIHLPYPIYSPDGTFVRGRRDLDFDHAHAFCFPSDDSLIVAGQQPAPSWDHFSIGKYALVRDGKS